ncbi:hypothetical protein [Nostoc parmelioides]|uniref:Glycosyltransferase n=1 Tax=Nostoc parmelioides FACHB-3921 TaxID=2692909 RepID=A0ABR8BIT1_9NOSO|nr:hypothetical protein [Nostoc parmelioides]MBD2254012.1 hypothetical protein [Nostoc parmelioides FACHB-3921]
MMNPSQLPPIYFYIPDGDWRATMPTNPDVYWKEFGGVVTPTVYGWTVQTYLRLKHAGFPCELVSKIPDEGILIAYRRSVPEEFKPGAKVLFVCLKSEQNPHPYAQIHVVGNIKETAPQVDIQGYRYYMPHWPQPGLIPRDTARGDRFETAAFFGELRNLAPELQDAAFAQQLEKLGLSWQILDRTQRDRWNDFSAVDVIIAVRKFGHASDYAWKPALKLYNAWHAGVPAILGQDSAFRNERRSELDYLEVGSVEEVITNLKQLKDDVELRQAIVTNGNLRAQESSVAYLTQRWQNFMTEIAVPAYWRWLESSTLQQQIFMMNRYSDFKLKKWRSQVRKWRGSVTTPMKTLLMGMHR